ncbi:MULTISPECIES: hypothetical protein [unclassified Campylobacter]|uniref:hypothetical protein n=1 Tax=unclassified Campylobacter TaxID=2593542 RepID=UPI001B402237|nr:MULTISPECIES: hypothetical protein [unclassified Campylobacter]MBP3224374.1 hypothetical protein [Campylobacter sp.]MDA3048909.1 hypothetical protein [Campylobacter sp. JMF_15 NE4]MDA3050381.1 hypothetical protein [Campylobacter sp. JMF_02 ED1]MDA3054316.1 hypothetical protein [Campylobacter sp. VBCF_07 NA4]MDA3061008.1 hypothetical protein [Campylobacter sp. VBCF_02 NA5]
MEKLKKFAKSAKAKALTLGALAFVGVNNAMADVTMSADGKVSGNFDISPLYGVATAIFTALGAIVVVRWAISFIRRG